MKAVLMVLLSPFFVLAGDDPDFPINQMINMNGYMGYRPVPNGVGYSDYFDPPLEYRLNSRGFRDDENGLKKNAIIALGASYTFGTGIKAEDRWSELLESRLCETEVRNISVAGYMIDQSYILLSEQIPINNDTELIIYEPPHLPDNMAHLSQEGWTPGDRKPYIKFENDIAQVVPGDTPIPWSLMVPEEDSLYKKFVVGYNRLLFDWFLFPKSEKKSIDHAARILKATYELARRHKKDMIILIHQHQLGLAVEKAGLLDISIDVKDVPKNHKVDDTVGHVNEVGNSILADRIMKKIEQLGISQYFCK